MRDHLKDNIVYVLAHRALEAAGGEITVYPSDLDALNDYAVVLLGKADPERVIARLVTHERFRAMLRDPDAAA